MRTLFLCLFVFSLQSLMGAPIVNTINPAVSPSTGGIVVQIQGSGFTGATAVDFGDTPAASFIVQSNTLITATTPAHVPQVVPVSVTTPSGNSSYLFTFLGDWQAYVVNDISEDTSIVNLSTYTVFNIPVGPLPTNVGLLPNGEKAYVLNSSGNTVSVIDAVTQSIIATIPVDLEPFSLVITPDGTKAYVANRAGSDVSVIDTATDTVIGLPIPVGSNPSSIAITPAGDKVFVVNIISSDLTVIDVATDLVLGTINVGAFPVAIGITPDGMKAYVLEQGGGGNVTVINTNDLTILTTIPVGAIPQGMAISKDGKKVYVANIGDDTVSIINTASDLVVNTINVGNGPLGIAILPDGSKIYVTNTNSNDVTVIDATGAVIDTLPLGMTPAVIVSTADGKNVLVVVGNSNEISVIDTALDAVIQNVAVGAQPVNLAITPDQAPLARFTTKVDSVLMPTIFDASASVSPVGTISNYFWDFGDGHTLNTTESLVSHVYQTVGTYLVSLTVTNSAGTSTTQIFNMTSSLSGSSHNMSLSNNGGPTATTAQSITIPKLGRPLPPQNFNGRQIENKFLTQTDLVNILKWSPSPSLVTSYYLYRNGVRIASISAGAPLVYEDHHRICGVKDHYRLTAVNVNGLQSRPVKLTLP